MADASSDATSGDSARFDGVGESGSDDASSDARLADVNAGDDIEPTADATSGDSADVSSRPDSTGGDAGCPCIPFDNSDPRQPPVELSLECFAVNARWFQPYSAYIPDICFDMRVNGTRRVDTYADHNLIGIWSVVSGTFEPHYGYFYDATTKELVGAVRAASYGGGDPLSCSGPGQLGKYNRVYAGKIPSCDFSGGSVYCPATTSQPAMCRADAGATDASSEPSIADAAASDTEASDMDASDAMAAETPR